MTNTRRNLPRLAPAPEIIEWQTDMARVLIEERRRLEQSFSDRSHHDSLWTRIANYIRGTYQYEVTARQCQVKWYSLKRGYENLKRLMSDDPDADGVQVRSPHWHDRVFFENLSDEFWLNRGDYLIHY
jgi:hypothetical protein